MSDLSWEPPGEGAWFHDREHFPRPSCGLFIDIFPEAACRGWARGAARFGVPMAEPRFAPVNGWLYYAPGTDPPDPADFEAAARAALDTCAWRDEVRRWREEERPAVLATNLALQGEDVDAMSGAELADHFRRGVEHFRAVAPLHFEHSGVGLAFGLLVKESTAWGLDPRALVPLLAGASPASAETLSYLDAIAGALRAAGTESVGGLHDVRAASSEAAAALDRYLEWFGWRILDSHDVADHTLGERPELVAAAINARLAEAGAAAEPDVASVRASVPAEHRARFDELLADARHSYGLRDDDVGLCFNWPAGLIRRAVLAGGRRLVADGRLRAAEDLLEATAAEVVAVLNGAHDPDGAELAGRADRRAAAASAEPPVMVGAPPAKAPAPGPLPDAVQAVMDIESAGEAAWSHDRAPLRGAAIGTGVHRGRALVMNDGDPGALARLEPGDVLVASATTSAYNAVFPIVAAVLTQEGGLMSHAAIVARELGTPALVGVGGLLDHVVEGDELEVDCDAGVVRVLSRRTP